MQVFFYAFCFIFFCLEDFLRAISVCAYYKYLVLEWLTMDIIFSLY